MLVFRRQKGESFLVGEDVEVRILHLGRGYVKIGVIAPRNVGIYRSEIARLNREARLPDWSDPKVEQTVRELRGWLKSGRNEK